MLTNSFKEHIEEEKSESPDNYIPVHSTIDNNHLTRPSAIIRKDNDLTQTGHSFNKRSQSKSSRQVHNIIENLKQQNLQLKNQIFNMKLSQFYKIDEKKIKGLLQQIEQLKEKIKYYREELQKVLIEKDFLERNNRNLKQQCFNLTKALMLEKRQKNGKMSKFTHELQLQGISTLNATKDILTQSKKSRDKYNSSRKSRNNSPYRQLLRIRSQQNYKAQLFSKPSNDKNYKIQEI